jgi:hypothetical protein
MEFGIFVNGYIPGPYPPFNHPLPEVTWPTLVPVTATSA